MLDIGADRCGSGFDPKTGNNAAPNSGEMNLFGPRGGELDSPQLRGRDVRRIIVAPQHEQFRVSSEKWSTCYRSLMNK